VDVIWVNELGGVTFRIDGGREYVKVAPPRWAHHVGAEAEPRTAATAIGAGLTLLHDAPNALIHDDGSRGGHVDLGDLGIADPWADLAVAMLSL
jgi:kanamycin kinase